MSKKLGIFKKSIYDYKKIKNEQKKKKFERELEQ